MSLNITVTCNHLAETRLCYIAAYARNVFYLGEILQGLWACSMYETLPSEPQWRSIVHACCGPTVKLGAYLPRVVLPVVWVEQQAVREPCFLRLIPQLLHFCLELPHSLLQRWQWTAHRSKLRHGLS